MSLFSILTVSVPEAFFGIYLGFVLTGLRSRLYLDKLNTLRLLTAVALMVTIAVTARAVLPNLLFAAIINIPMQCIILKFVYRLKWSEAILNVIIIFGVLITIEAIYLSQYFKSIDMNSSVLWPDDMKRLIASIPERIIQFIIIVSLWKWDLAYLNLKGNKKIMITFILLIVMLFAAEGTFLYMFVYYMDIISPLFRVVGLAVSVMLAFVNFLIFRVITVLSKNSNWQK